MACTTCGQKRNPISNSALHLAAANNAESFKKTTDEAYWEGINKFYSEIPETFVVTANDSVLKKETRSIFTVAKPCGCKGQDATMTDTFVNENKALYLVSREALKARPV